MKIKLFLTAFYIFISCITYGQYTVKIYADKNWKKTFNRKEAEFYRVINFDSSNRPTGLVKDYYMDGTLQYEAHKTYADTVNPKLDTTDGEAKWYAKNGQLIHQSFYKNGKMDGEQKRWFENGVVKSTAHFNNGKLDGEYISYYENGNYHYKINYSEGLIVGKRGTYFSSHMNKYDYFYDDFKDENNRYDWKIPESNDAGVKCYIMPDTGIYIQNNSKQDLIAHLEIPRSAKSGFNYLIKVKKDSGDPMAGYGLVYDYKDENNYSYFIIRSDGFFLIGRKLNGEEMSELKWKKTKLLLGNNLYDELSISRYGLETKFRINDKEVAKGSFVPFTGSRFGVLCQKGEQSIILRTIISYQF